METAPFRHRPPRGESSADVAEWLASQAGLDPVVAGQVHAAFDDHLEDCREDRFLLQEAGRSQKRLNTREQARLERQAKRRVNQELRGRLGLLGWMQLIWRIARAVRLLIEIYQLWPTLLLAPIEE